MAGPFLKGIRAQRRRRPPQTRGLGEGELPRGLAMRRRAGEGPAERLNEGYDRLMFSGLVEDYYGNSDFCNWGYWLEGTRTQQEACENLMEKILSLVPRKQGKVLDVACGKGATTRHLLRYFPAAGVTGINISDSQLERAQRNAPGATFLRMDATDLRFPDASFDVVVCVEAAFHFPTRERFLHEAFRVLKPGGRLALSDILFTRLAEAHGPGLDIRNWLPGPDAYRQLLSRVGFRDIQVADVTQECWSGYEEYQGRFLWSKLLGREMDLRTFRALKLRGAMRRIATRFYLLAAGTRP